MARAWSYTGFGFLKRLKIAKKYFFCFKLLVYCIARFFYKQKNIHLYYISSDVSSERGWEE
jgi:hypothetical protein